MRLGEIVLLKQFSAFVVAAVAALIFFTLTASGASASQVASMPDHQGNSFVGLDQAPGGKFVGAVGSLDGGARYFVVRIGSNGKLDSSFGSKGKVSPFGNPRNKRVGALGMAVSKDGSIATVGFQTRAASPVRGVPNQIAPLVAVTRSNGAPAKGFSKDGRIGSKIPYRGGGDTFHGASFRGDNGLIVVGGRNETVFTGRAGIIKAYLPNGKVDRGFGNRGAVLIKRKPRKSAKHSTTFTSFDQVKVLPSGQMLVSGLINGFLSVLKLNARGHLVKGFGNRGLAQIKVPQDYCGTISCATNATRLRVRKGQIFLASAPSTFGVPKAYVARLTLAGKPVRKFGRQGVASLSMRVIAGAISDPSGSPYFFHPLGLAVTSNLKPTIVGSTLVDIPDETADQSRATTIALNQRGQLDKSFGRRGIKADVESVGSISSAAFIQGKTVVIGGSRFQGQGASRKTFLTISRFRR